MTEKTEVSVLMPTFNDAKYVSDAIESLLRQSEKRWELIVIDDGSTDGTPEIIKEYNDSRIKLYSRENAGQLNALYYGANFISGKYVTLLHSDDALLSKDAFADNI